MKAFLLGLLFFVLAAVGGFIGLKYFYKSPADTGQEVFKTAPVTKIGTLRKSAITQSDFTHVLVVEGKSTGVSSYSLNLDDYIGKKVSITGQFSGTTLYADTVTEVE